jgi:hypothetical protein
VIVAVIVMGMVKVTIDQIIDMVAVRHRFMATAGSVHVARFVAFARVPLGAVIGIRVAHGQPVLVVVVAMRMQQMAVLKVVRMAFVLDGEVATLIVMFVDMPAVGFAVHFLLLIGSTRPG